MAKAVAVLLTMLLLMCVVGCGSSPYRAATAEDIVVGAKICPYLSSDADMRDIPGAWATVTMVRNGYAYHQFGDGSGDWSSISELTTTKRFKNGSYYRWEVKK